ncbi:MAG: transporter substrate-binding domain-containing protein [Clostridia bacterium]|nr:transporter substrate-binding domain-containing protein [Clostridia bacterium]
MKKILALVLALALVLSVAAATAEYKTIEEGKFIYATSPDFPPFESTDDNDNVIGIEPDILAIICENLGLTPEPYAIDFDSALVAPSAGKADAVVSGVTIKEERKSSMDFTIPYVTIVQGIVFKTGADITMDNLGEKMIGAQSGTTGKDLAVDNFGEDHVTSYDKYSLAFQALQNGQVDCIIVDDMVGAAYVKQIPGLEMFKTDYTPENFAFGFAKGNTELLDAFNAELQKLIDDGTIEQIILKWQE